VAAGMVGLSGYCTGHGDSESTVWLLQPLYLVKLSKALD